MILYKIVGKHICRETSILSFTELFVVSINVVYLVKIACIIR